MPETDIQDLSGVAQTLLIPLYTRAIESQRPDPLIKDEKAVALVTRMSNMLPHTVDILHRRILRCRKSPLQVARTHFRTEY